MKKKLNTFEEHFNPPSVTNLELSKIAEGIQSLNENMELLNNNLEEGSIKEELFDIKILLARICFEYTKDDLLEIFDKSKHNKTKKDKK